MAFVMPYLYTLFKLIKLTKQNFIMQHADFEF